MRPSLLNLCCAVFIATGLIGCQSLPSQSQSSVISKPAVPDHFQLQGKIGVRSAAQSGSAFYSWVQQGDQFEIELSGILGVGKTQISGSKFGPVELNSAKTGLIHAQTPEELLLQATGWQAPITYLMDWVQARPATQQAHVQRDAQGRVSQLQEANWQVDFSYTEQAQLPERLVLVQADHRITLLIQNR